MKLLHKKHLGSQVYRYIYRVEGKWGLGIFTFY